MKPIHNKTSLIVAALVAAAAGQAQAGVIPTTSIGRAYNDGWWYTAGSSYISPANRGGVAFGFELSSQYRVSMITGFIQGVGDEPGNYRMTLFGGSRYAYDGITPMPSDNKIWQSPAFVNPLNGDEVAHVAEADLDLDAGQYWLAYNGGSAGLSQVRASGFELQGDELAKIHTPEPASLILMGSGLFGLMRLRRKP
jgi:hypothetical protein